MKKMMELLERIEFIEDSRQKAKVRHRMIDIIILGVFPKCRKLQDKPQKYGRREKKSAKTPPDKKCFLSERTFHIRLGAKFHLISNLVDVVHWS